MARECFDEELEALPKRSLCALQLQRLQEVVQRAYSSSRFYRALYDEGGVKPSDIRGLEDIQNLPFLDASALREAHPHGLNVAPRRQHREISGRPPVEDPPVLLVHTRKDLRNRAQLHARELWAAGLRDGDVILNLLGCGMGDPGHGVQDGAHAAAMVAVPSPCGCSSAWLNAASELGVVGLCASPSDLLDMAAQAEAEAPIQERAPKLRLAVCYGGQWPDGSRDEARQRIEKGLGVTLTDAVSMTYAPLYGTGVECHHSGRLHIWADAFLVECIDPESNDWVAEGHVGELVWTWLAGDGSALIRYRSGDLGTLTWEGKCACGRTHPTISPILGRADEAVQVAGRMVMTAELEQRLRALPDLTGEYRITVERPRTIDRVTVEAEVCDAGILDEKEAARRTIAQVADAAKAVVGVRVQVELRPPRSMPPVRSRAERIDDRRKVAGYGP